MHTDLVSRLTYGTIVRVGRKREGIDVKSSERGQQGVQMEPEQWVEEYGDVLYRYVLGREDLAPRIQQQFVAAYRSTNPAHFRQLRNQQFS